MQVSDYHYADTSMAVSTGTVDDFDWALLLSLVLKIALAVAIGYVLYRLGLWALAWIVRRTSPTRQSSARAVYRVLCWIPILFLIAPTVLGVELVQLLSLFGPATYLLIGFASGFAFHHALASSPTSSALRTDTSSISDD